MYLYTYICSPFRGQLARRKDKHKTKLCTQGKRYKINCGIPQHVKQDVYTKHTQIKETYKNQQQ